MMNHSFSQIIKQIISKWYILILAAVVIFGLSYVLISKTSVGGSVNQYRAVLAPQTYVDQAKQLKADYDNYMLCIVNDRVIDAVINSDPYLKEKLTITTAIKSIKTNKINAINIEVLFSHTDALVSKKFMENFFSDDESVGITTLRAVYQESYPDYPMEPGSDKLIERGDININNAAALYEQTTGNKIVGMVICTMIGYIIFLLIMLLPFILRKIDYVDKYLVEDFDTKILGGIRLVEPTKE